MWNTGEGLFGSSDGDDAAELVLTKVIQGNRLYQSQEIAFWEKLKIQEHSISGF